MIVDAPWYVPNTVIRRDLQIPTVKEEIRRYSSQYSALLSAHPNGLIVSLTDLTYASVSLNTKFLQRFIKFILVLLVLQIFLE
jgi:hypothetical protein